MAAYIRPPIEAPVFRDADGQVIPYGRRWRNGDPPEDSYSRVSHPERFAPLHQVAEALVRHLTEDYDARSEDAPAPEGALRSIRVTPSGPDQAPLTFVFTDFPSVSIRAGLLHEQGFPSCGCDACDEDWREPADELERLVLTVAAGGFAEWCRPGFGSRYGSSLEFFDGGGSHSGETSARTVSAERFKAAKRRLRALPDGWAAWSPKA
ncbi:hypothetical protein GCM10029992_06750 [Glycomyces albus]